MFPMGGRAPIYRDLDEPRLVKLVCACRKLFSFGTWGPIVIIESNTTSYTQVASEITTLNDRYSRS